MSEDKPINMGENVEIALNDVQGKVVMLWHQPRQHIVFDPQDAFNFAEQVARAAHRARFPGERLPDDFSYLAQQVRERLTDEMRDRLVLRVRTMLPSLMQKNDPNYMAAQIVDTIFSSVDPEGGYKL